MQEGLVSGGFVREGLVSGGFGSFSFLVTTKFTPEGEGGSGCQATATKNT